MLKASYVVICDRCQKAVGPPATSENDAYCFAAAKLGIMKRVEVRGQLPKDICYACSKSIPTFGAEAKA